MRSADKMALELVFLSRQAFDTVNNIIFGIAWSHLVDRWTLLSSKRRSKTRPLCWLQVHVPKISALVAAAAFRRTQYWFYGDFDVIESCPQVYWFLRDST